MTFAPNIVIPEICWSNQMRSSDAVLEYQGATEDPKYPLINAIDWKDWTLFKVKEGITDVLFYLSAHPIMTTSNFCWFVKTLLPTDTGFSIRVYKQVSPGVFSPITSPIDPLITPIGMINYGTISGPGTDPYLIRFVVPAGKSLYVRQLFLGLSLIPETGQNVGVAPPSLQQSWKTTNALSVNGSLIGRNTIRLVKEYEINLEYLSFYFVNVLWKEFCTHILRYPFFFRWNPSSFPLDTMFASAKTVESPSVSKPGQRFTAKMPLVGISE